MITIAMTAMTMMMVNITKWTREHVMMNVSVFEDDPEVPSMMMITMTTMTMKRNIVNKMLLQGSIGRQRWRSNLATVSRSVLPTVFPPVEIYIFVHINISWHFVYT